MQKTSRKMILFVVLASLFGAGNADAFEQSSSASAILAEELSGLAKAIDNLAQQITKETDSAEQGTSLRKLDIAIAYLNFRSRRIEMFERDLQAAKTGRNRLDDALENFRLEDKKLQEIFDDSQKEALRRARDEMEVRQQAIKLRMSRMDEEIILLENRIMEMQSQIDSVESYVQKHLEF